MLEEASESWRDTQRAAARERILAAAWEHAERDGVGALSLRKLARSLGMTAPSLYSYFDSKDAIFDAMFAQAWEELQQRLEALDLERLEPPRERIVGGARAYLEFCRESLARYELMSRRPVPGWEPSPEAYAASLRSYERMARLFAGMGITEQRHLDLYTAVFGGLAAQQMSNEPGGDRWVRLCEEAADMFLAHIEREQEGGR